MPIILASDVGSVRILTLNRPEVRNALSSELRGALLVELDRAEAQGAVRAVIITGAGSSFCSGLDLAELEGLLELTPDQHRQDAAALAQLFVRIYRLEKPVIAALNGHAVAGGAGLASVCDVVVAARGSKIGYSEVRLGFVAALVSVFLVRQLGERRARDLLLSARLVAASEACELGLVDEVVAPEELMERALARATALCANAPTALALSKELLADLGGAGLDEALARAIEVNVAARASPDLREGVRAFLEKRSPRWGGTSGSKGVP